MCNSVLLFVSHCFSLSWPGRSCKRELVLNWPTWLNKGEIKNKIKQYIMAQLPVVTWQGATSTRATQTVFTAHPHDRFFKIHTKTTTKHSLL
jgi:hypothetical protein